MTAALLMRAIDRKNNHSESLQFLDKLKQYDSNRTGYYVDLANKWSIEHCLAEWITQDSDRDAPIRDTPINLSHLNLVNLHYKQYLCVADEIDLTGNEFGAKQSDNISTFFTHCNVNFKIDQ